MFEKMIYHTRLTWRLLFDPRVPNTSKMIPVAALIYVLSPLDLIPDIFLTLGQLDDIGIILMSMRVFIQTVPADIVAEHRAILDGEDTTRKASDTIPGKATKAKRTRQKERQ